MCLRAAGRLPAYQWDVSASHLSFVKRKRSSVCYLILFLLPAGFCLSFIGFGRKLRPDSGTKQFGDLGNAGGLIFGVEQNYPAGTQDTIIVSKKLSVAIVSTRGDVLTLWMRSEGLVLGLQSCPLCASETRPFSLFGACVSSSFTVALSFGAGSEASSSLVQALPSFSEGPFLATKWQQRHKELSLPTLFLSACDVGSVGLFPFPAHGYWF